ncbi:MAG: hypothetical protein IJO68_01275 [Clostridia bacterium]|nr:hypothetical protein [Clostridia bacterium]
MFCSFSGSLSGSQYIVPSVLYFETSFTSWKAMSADAAKICDEKTQTMLKTEYYAYYAGI